MSLYDLFGQVKTYPKPCISLFAFSTYTVKSFKNIIVVFLFNSNTLIFYTYRNLIFFVFLHPYNDILTFGGIFYRIGNKVYKNLPYTVLIGKDPAFKILYNFNMVLGIGKSYILNCFIYQVI